MQIHIYRHTWTGTLTHGHVHTHIHTPRGHSERNVVRYLADRLDKLQRRVVERQVGTR